MKCSIKNLKFLTLLLFFPITFLNAQTDNLDYSNFLQNVTFNFSFQVESTFSFNLDSMENNPWVVSYKILSSNSTCYKDNASIYVKQTFKYDFSTDFGVLVLEKILIENRYIYLILKSPTDPYRRLWVYNSLIDENQYNIVKIENILKLDLYEITKPLIFFEKNDDHIFLSTFDNFLSYVESTNCSSQQIYCFNIITNIIFNTSISAMKSFFLNEDTYFLIFSQNTTVFYFNPKLQNLFSEINTIAFSNGYFLSSCMDYLFFLVNGQIDIKQSIINNNTLMLIQLKTLKPLINLIGFIRSERSLIIYNETFISEYIFINDCLDIHLEKNYEIQQIYKESGLSYSNQFIKTLFIYETILIFQSNTNETFIKRLQLNNENYWYLSSMDMSPLIAINKIEFLIFDLKNLYSLNYLRNNSEIILQTIEKSEEKLNCEVSDDSLSTVILSSTRFCDKKMFNFSNSKIYDPNESCLHYSHFFITKKGLNLSIKLLIIFISVILSLCLLISAGYILRKWYKKRKRLQAYIENNQNQSSNDEVEINDIELLQGNDNEVHLEPETLFLDSARFKNFPQSPNSNRNLLNNLNKTGEIEIGKIRKEKSQFETSRIALKVEDISFMTPQKSEEFRGGDKGEDIGEEAKSQEAKLIFEKKSLH